MTENDSHVETNLRQPETKKNDKPHDHCEKLYSSASFRWHKYAWKLYKIVENKLNKPHYTLGLNEQENQSGSFRYYITYNNSSSSSLLARLRRLQPPPAAHMTECHSSRGKVNIGIWNKWRWRSAEVIVYLSAIGSTAIATKTKERNILYILRLHRSKQNIPCFKWFCFTTP